MTHDPARDADAKAGPSIYYLHPLLAGPLTAWPAQFARIADLGFDHVLIAPPFQPARHGSLMLSASHHELHPALHWPGDADAGLTTIAAAARANGLTPLLGVVLDRVAEGGPLANAAGSPFTQIEAGLDPRQFSRDGQAARASLDSPAAIARLAAFWGQRLRAWAGLGIGGVCVASLRTIPPSLLRAIADAVAPTGLRLLGWTPGLSLAALAPLAGCGLDYVFASLPWWDGSGDWFWREQSVLATIAPVLMAAEAPFDARIGESLPASEARVQLARSRQALAATLGAGWMLTMGAEFATSRRLEPRGDPSSDLAANPAADLTSTIRALNNQRRHLRSLASTSVPVLLSGPGDRLLAVLRPDAPDPRRATAAVLIVANLDPFAPLEVATATLLGDAGNSFVPFSPGAPLKLTAAEVRVFEAPAAPPILRRTAGATAAAAARAPRIAIEAVTPSVDEGRFPARLRVGEQVQVQADIICDGHDKLGVVLRWRCDDEAAWQSAAMRPLGNDRWQGAFPLLRLGLHHFTVEAWRDAFATYHDELSKKFAAGLDVTLEVEEGRRLIASHMPAAPLEHQQALAQIGRTLLAASLPDQTALLLSDTTAALMAAVDPHPFAVWLEPPLPLEAERTAAGFASWYEIFPRSMSGDDTRHGDFDDVIAALPRIRAMGFDVLYFPPIHPIGKLNRKGRNNALSAGPDDPGSPYGIADHTAIHPALGTLDDFRRLLARAGAQGLEIALDFAIQCAPDHPWLKQHPGWFDWRPDGSIRYAENPPKKYQDIVNVDFYAAGAIPGLWQELLNAVLFWCHEGVRIFRVDNPHTKPLPFWHWMIGEVRAHFPDTLFLAEAFTKPKMMYRLAKVGFSQSYTYFTWRNTKDELRSYLEELNELPQRDFFRPNFFVNTPDINPTFLHESGRPGFLIRAALAATLAGLWGMYCGFELCEAAALPGREEYQDSEKYQIRAWNWDRPGNIVREISQLNHIRRTNPALHSHLGITFLAAGNDQILYFEKATVDRSNVLLIAINLDPRQTQEAAIEVPLWRWDRPDWAAIRVEDLVWEVGTIWTGKIQRVRLDPNSNPYAIWRVRPV